MVEKRIKSQKGRLQKVEFGGWIQEAAEAVWCHDSRVYAGLFVNVDQSTPAGVEMGMRARLAHGPGRYGGATVAGTDLGIPVPAARENSWPRPD